MLNVIDEFSHECLAIRVARNLKAIDVIDVLSDLFILHGIPAISAPTTAQSSSSRPCRTGLPLSVQRPLTSTAVSLKLMGYWLILYVLFWIFWIGVRLAPSVELRSSRLRL
jgi:hypothetical protein